MATPSYMIWEIQAKPKVAEMCIAVKEKLKKKKNHDVKVHNLVGTQLCIIFPFLLLYAMCINMHIQLLEKQG